MEVFVILELLPDQGGADHLAVLLDQAALRLLRKDHAGNRGHGEWIGEARDQRERDQDDDGRTDFFQHGVSPQTRCKALTIRSTALMPIKGMMMPPTPYTNRLRRSSAPAPMAR